MKQSLFFIKCVVATLLAACAVLVCVLPVGAESPGHRIAVLTPGLTFKPVLEGLREGLARLGYDQRTVTYIVEEAEGAAPELMQRASRLVEARPDVIFTVATSHTAAAKKVTDAVPIVFAWAAEPVKFGWAASYASSKTNVTGVATASAQISGKRLEILKEISPGIKRILAIVSAKDSVSETSFKLLEETATKFKVEVLRRDVTNKGEIEKVILDTPKGSADAIYHVPSALVGAHIALLIEKAKDDRIPLAVHETSMVEKGAMVSYGADFKLVGFQAAKQVAKVFKGVKPTDIPIETPERNILVLNLGTAKTIGLKVPREVLERADQLIE